MNPHDADQRLTELEIKLSFAEDTIDRLNDIVVRQQQQIDLITRELLALRQQRGADDAPAARRPARRTATALLIPPAALTLH